MAAISFPSPSRSAFVKEDKAATFLGVSVSALRRAVGKLGWVTRRKQGRYVYYATKDITLIAELSQKKNGLPEGIFSRLPGEAPEAPEKPRKPQKNKASEAQDQDC